MIKNMTEGSPWKLLLQFALPVIAGNIFQQLYNVVDTVIVGRMLGVNALAAVGATYGMSFMTVGIVVGMTSGFGILLAQYFGAGNQKALAHYTAMSFLLSVVIAVVMSVGLCAANVPILHLMNTPEEILDQTASYIGVIYAGMLASFLYNMLAALSRALGDSKTPLYFLVLSSALNIVLDIAIIGLLHTGVEGAAIATVISQAVSAVLCFFYVKKKYRFFKITREDMRFSGKSAAGLMKLGIPMALQFSITAIGVMIVQSFLNTLGPSYIAGHSTAGKINNLVTQVFPAIGVAVATYVGQNKGAGKYDRIRSGVWSVQIMVLLFSVICGAFVWFLGQPLAGIFVSEGADAVISAAVQHMRITIWFYPFLGTIFVYRNALQGLGYGLVPMLGGVFELIARAVSAYLLVKPFGYTGICFTDPCAWVSALIPLIPVYFYHMKKQKLQQA